jgi:hypothetical protein
MWIAIQWAQVTAGVGFELLGKPERFLPHAVGQWLLSLCDSLADSEFTLEVVSTYTVRLRRVHDRILMDDVLAGFSSESEIQGINRCRLYLQVECLSDICTADGVRLDTRLQKNTYSHFNEQDPVALPRPTRSTLVGHMGPIPQNVHAWFSVPSATANHGTTDSTQSSVLECILRHSIRNALPACANTSNGHDRHQRLLALPPAQITTRDVSSQ